MKIRMGCGIGYVGAEHTQEIEIDDSELEGKTEDEIEQYIYDAYVTPFADNYLEMWYDEIEEEEEEEE